MQSPMTDTSNNPSSPVPEELRCCYSSKRCDNPRTNKKSGGLHKFCAYHRDKANRNQMRLDHRRRLQKKQAQALEQRAKQAAFAQYNAPLAPISTPDFKIYDAPEASSPTYCEFPVDEPMQFDEQELQILDELLFHGEEDVKMEEPQAECDCHECASYVGRRRTPAAIRNY